MLCVISIFISLQKIRRFPGIYGKKRSRGHPSRNSKTLIFRVMHFLPIQLNIHTTDRRTWLQSKVPDANKLHAQLNISYFTTTTSLLYSESQMPAENNKTSAIISVNAIYCRFPFIYTIQGLDLFLDLLGDLSFSESVVESSVDIFQVSASASTWGSSSLGLGGPVELGNQFSFSILS